MDNTKVNWKNVYYMITYAIDELAHMVVDDATMERLKSLDDLLASLMCRSVEIITDHNYLQDYDRVKVETDKPSGTILMRESYESGAYARGKLECKRFEFRMNNLANKIIKSATFSLYEGGQGISDENLLGLREILDKFNSVDILDVVDIDFQDISYNTLPDWYKPAIVVSKLIVREMMASDSDSGVRLFNLDDETRLAHIFEKFVRNYYKREYYRKAMTTRPTYRIDGGRIHELDMLLESETVALIIDTKWYNGETGRNRSANMSQVYDYIGSYKENEIIKGNTGRKKMNAVILYAMTEHNKERLDRVEVRDLGKDFGTCTIQEEVIDLEQEFENIKKSLDNIADKFIL